MREEYIKEQYFGDYSMLNQITFEEWKLINKRWVDIETEEELLENYTEKMQWGYGVHDEDNGWKKYDALITDGSHFFYVGGIIYKLWYAIYKVAELDPYGNEKGVFQFSSEEMESMGFKKLGISIFDKLRQEAERRHYCGDRIGRFVL